MATSNSLAADSVTADQVKSGLSAVLQQAVRDVFHGMCLGLHNSKVKNQEEKCALNCMEKYLSMNQRVSQRFQEFQMIANENAMAAAQKMGVTPQR